MGTDINSLISNAMDLAQQRRAAASGVTDSVFNPDNVKSSATSLGVTELSIEDLAGAMKNRNASKSNDNKTISDKFQGIGKISKEPKHSEAVEKTQDKIIAIDNTTVKALARQSEVAQSLKSQSSNPFTF